MTAERDRPPGDPPSGSRRVAARTGAFGTGVAVIVVVVVVAAGAGLVGRMREASARSTRVEVIGDSLVFQARTPLDQALSDAGFEPRVVGLPAQSLTTPAVRGQINVAEQEGSGIVVVATAANDARTYAEVAETRGSAAAYHDDISELLARLADRCVVIVNARERVDPMYFPERAAMLNRELALLARQRSNLVVVDWATRSRALPATSFSSDQLHFGDPADVEQPESPSARDYAAAIVDGVRRCPSRR